LGPLFFALTKAKFILASLVPYAPNFQVMVRDLKP